MQGLNGVIVCKEMAGTFPAYTSRSRAFSTHPHQKEGIFLMQRELSQTGTSSLHPSGVRRAYQAFFFIK